MKFLSSAVGMFLAAAAAPTSHMGGVSAFSPRGNYVASSSGRSGLIVPSSFSESPSSSSTEDGNSSNNHRPSLWRPGMKMVAGGAERSYGQEYYEGE
jgi:hypothetical protein